MVNPDIDGYTADEESIFGSENTARKYASTRRENKQEVDRKGKNRKVAVGKGEINNKRNEDNQANFTAG
jgi:hypothetical protein